MLTNYFRIALRYLLKNRTFSLINIFGLTLGFLCFMLITLYLHDELSFDSFHRDTDRIYRVVQHEQQEDGTIRDVASIASQVGPESLKQLPEVEDAIRIAAFGRITVGNDPANRDYEPTLTIDSSFFKFFDFELIQGDPATALSRPDGIVITEKMANKYFGDQPAFGKPLQSLLKRPNDEAVTFTVTGIVKEFPKNSHLQFDMIFSESTWAGIFPWYTPSTSTDWTSNTFVTYLKVKPGTDLKALESKLTAMIKSNYPPADEFKSTFSLQSLRDIHLYSDTIQGQGSYQDSNSAKPFYLYLFGAVAALILLIACLNYMNLSTAAAYKRTREIGTRKTLGAQKGQLILQFSGEAILLSTGSLILAIGFLQMILPAINIFTDKAMMISSLPLNWMLGLIGIMILAGALSSLYPAFIISRVMPSEALKKDVKLGNRSLPVRKLLVAGQFAVSIMMIASTLVIYRQLNYMREKELGINVKDQLVIDINSRSLRRFFENVKAEFLTVSEVQNIAASTRVPGEWKEFPVATVKTSEKPIGNEMIFVGIDKDFLSTYNIKLLEGRNFTEGFADSSKVILTQLAVEQLGLTNPIGQIIEIPTVRWGGSVELLDEVFRAEVIGVADNFHFESFRQKMMPLVFAFPNSPIQNIDYYTLTIKTNNWPETIEKLKAVNSKIDPNNPLEYTFLDNRFDEFYKADEKRGQIFLVFSAVIVLIACLGLFALVSYSIESRTKEIGIRKVLGASVQNIVGMISKEFLVLVLFSTLVALPAAWYLVNSWLNDFAYRVSVGAGMFILATAIALFIAFATISIRTIRAAVANPVNSLKSE